nr:transglycosylase domain-containing protein [Candidatus Dependentiae bacterium]
ALFYVAEQPWVDFSVLEYYNPGKPSLLLDDEGNEWGRFQLDKREIISLDQIPKHLIYAFLAAEDWGFYAHSGLSIKGIVRSMLVNITNLRRAQGASTITQQLVRLLFFEPKKSFKRKIKEQLLSLIVERQFTKEQILETYLNHIYLGSGIYGVEAAALLFWGKHASEVSVAEAASIASIVRYPQRYCPLYDSESNQKRRNLILKNMFTLKFITKEEYEEAVKKPVILLKRDFSILAPHLRETLRITLEKLVGKRKLYTGGLRIQTTLNRAMQKAAEASFNTHLALLNKKYNSSLEGALLSLEGSTGAIKALVGGNSFQLSQFNRALQSRRQMGSTFKPLLYAQALLEGKSFTDQEIDEPYTLMMSSKEWRPGNANDLFEGPMTLARALSTSNNIVAIKTFLATDRKKVISLAQACGLNPLHSYPSLALGCIEASLSEMVAMMNIFAHQGVYREPHSLLWIKDQWGTKLWKAEPITRKVLSPQISSQVAKILMHKIEQSRKKDPSTWFACDAFGKSGTTNEFKTCVYIGATPGYTTGVYLGRDDNRPFGRAFAARTSFPLWKKFNKAINNSRMHFLFDPSLQEQTVHAIFGTPCEDSDPYALPLLVPRNPTLTPTSSFPPWTPTITT